MVSPDLVTVAASARQRRPATSCGDHNGAARKLRRGRELSRVAAAVMLRQPREGHRQGRPFPCHTSPARLAGPTSEPTDNPAAGAGKNRAIRPDSHIAADLFSVANGDFPNESRKIAVDRA